MATPQILLDGPPIKRARTEGEGDDGHTEPIIVEDKTVWMDDGNIIISAGDDPVYHFKCHKSVLCKNSEVFSEMFGLQLSGDQREGLPVVPLPDPVNDVRALLDMLYDPMCANFDPFL